LVQTNAEEDGLDCDNEDGHDDDDNNAEGHYTEAVGQDVHLVGNGRAGSQSMMDIMMGNPSDVDNDDDDCPPLLPACGIADDDDDDSDEDDEKDDDDESIVWDGNDTGPAPIQNGPTLDECFEGIMESNAHLGSFVLGSINAEAEAQQLVVDLQAQADNKRAGILHTEPQPAPRHL
jgi:hypothetical protein